MTERLVTVIGSDDLDELAKFAVNNQPPSGEPDDTFVFIVPATAPGEQVLDKCANLCGQYPAFCFAMLCPPDMDIRDSMEKIRGQMARCDRVYVSSSDHAERAVAMTTCNVIQVYDEESEVTWRPADDVHGKFGTVDRTTFELFADIKGKLEADARAAETPTPSADDGDDESGGATSQTPETPPETTEQPAVDETSTAVETESAKTTE